jgi:protein O-mannosyl-transferase
MRVHDPQFFTRRLICVGLTVITLALYLPALWHGFVNYDDQQYVTDNPRVQAGITWNGFLWAFGFYAGNWHPLTWLSHMMDCQIFGARAWGHHLTNVLLHVANTLLLFFFLDRTTKATWRSAAVAALFAWHPLHVESVAWVAERKDVLCAFFWMLTLWFCARYAERPSATRYLAALGIFALCLMAKPMAVTLPFVLLLMDYWPLKRISDSPFQIQNFRRLVTEKIPFLILSVIGCALTIHAQQIAIVSTAGLTMSHRAAHTLAAYDHYFWAMFFPHNLAVYYPYVIHLQPTVIIFSGAVVVFMTILSLVNFRSRPWFMVGWLWFLGTLVPVIGLVQVGDQAWADRYTYLPLIGLFIPLVWLVVEIIKNKAALQLLAAAGSIAMLAATSVQLSYWRNTQTLFEHANKVTQKNYLAITMLGSLYAQENDYNKAIACYQQAMAWQPDFPEAHFFMGAALDKEGRTDGAIVEYQKALWFKPTQEQTHIFLGIALGGQKNYAGAITNYEAALAINPDSAVAENNLARIFHTQGKFDEAIVHYQAALNIDPTLALAHNNLGILFLQKGLLADGTRQLRAALQLDPTNFETQFNLAVALNQQQQWDEAAELFKKTASPQQSNPKAHYEFAVALVNLKKTREAMAEFAAAVLIQPDYPDALDRLAWILSTDENPDFRNGTEAVKMAERACALTENKDPAKLKTLAAAYAETGQFEEAIRTIKKAIDSTAIPNPDVAEYQLMLKQFQLLRPWRTS